MGAGPIALVASVSSASQASQAGQADHARQASQVSQAGEYQAGADRARKGGLVYRPMEAAGPRLPKAIYTADQVRGLDRTAIEEFGIPSYTLMCRAAEAAVAALRQRWPAAQSLAVYCGAGNNAGDGYVVARLASELGLQVRVITVVAPDRLSGDAARAWNDYRDQ